MSGVINPVSATSDSGIPIINYLTAVAPAGYATAFEALYQFDDTAQKLDDRINSHDLSTQSGTYLKVLRNGLFGWRCYAAYAYSGIDAVLASLGVFTAELTIATNWPQNSAREMFGVHGSPASELAVENLTVSILTNALTDCFGYLHEAGAGINVGGFTTAVAPACDLSYIAVTREADGVTYNFYCNGEFLETVVAAQPPTSGTNARIYVGGYTAAEFAGEIFSVRYSKGLMTAAQIAEVDAMLREV